MTTNGVATESFISLSANERKTVWCVYQLMTIPGVITHVGWCLMVDFLKQPMPVSDDDARWIIQLHSRYSNRQDAFRAADALRMKEGLKLWTISAKNKWIRCVETGETYSSAQDFVRLHDISQSALSAHLNGKKYNKTVKGRTYERVDGATAIQSLQAPVPQAGPIATPLTSHATDA